MQISIYTTVAAILGALTVAAAPAPAKRQVVLGEYSIYSDTECTKFSAQQNISPNQCNGLPTAQSIDATFDDAQGYEFRLYTDSACADFATVLPLNTCVNTQAYFSVSLYCTGDVECTSYGK